MSSKSTGIAIAAAAAAIFAASSMVAPLANAASHSGAGVKCEGTNSCKGHGECKTAKNECKGQNACKGQGWVKKASKEECEKAGGKVSS